jgi:hypothetical protein
MSSSEVSTIPFVGGGPLHGHAWANVTGDVVMSYYHGDDGSTIPPQVMSAVDCYDLKSEEGRQVLRYNRLKGDARGYQDRVVQGELYHVGGTFGPQWIPSFDERADGVFVPTRSTDDGPYSANCPSCDELLIAAASARVLSVASVLCPRCSKPAVGRDHPGAVIPRR